jgi:Flp pilus assembly protein TadG
MLKRIRDEQGAVAVIVAMLALTLFGAGALAVDIGNQWSRRRMAQSAADIAALAGAAQLPDAAAAVQTAFDYLSTHDPVAEGSFTKAQMTDNVVSNGEITVDPAKNTVTVDLAPRRVTFGLANALGFSAGLVSAHAVAALRTPSQLLPFFLPVDCSNGQEIIKQGPQSVGPVTEPPTVFQPSASGKNPAIASISVTSGTQGTPILAMTIAGNHFEATGMHVDFTRGTTRFDVAVGVGAVNVGANALVVDVPTGVTDVAGVWYVRVMTASHGWSGDSSAQQLTVVAGPPPPPTGCGQKETGDFGLLDSPRKDVTGNQPQLDRNIALGLDHGILPFPSAQLPPPSDDKACEVTPNTPIPGGVYDNDATIDTANCLDINNGNKVDAATSGLIQGGAGFVGRLTRSGSRSCTPPSGLSNPTNFMNAEINNDTIDCFLTGTHTVSDLIDPDLSTAVLDPSIVDSPRFFLVPVIDSNVNPKNGFYPIVTFRGVFITNQTKDLAPTGTNGLTSNNNGTKLTSIQVLAFNLAAVPQDLSDGGNGVPFIGQGPRVVRLIQ